MGKKIPAGNFKKFNQYQKEIIKVLDSKQSFWHLHAVVYKDWLDIRMEIMAHIFHKIHLFNPEKSEIGAWCNTVISNQLKNKLRNEHGSLLPACHTCPNDCEFKHLSEDCPKYKEWEVTKKAKFDVRHSVSLEHHTQEVFDRPDLQLDYNKLSKELFDRVKPLLTDQEWRVCYWAYVKHKEDDEICNKLGFRTKKKAAGLRFINVTKKKIVEISKDLLKDGF